MNVEFCVTENIGTVFKDFLKEATVTIWNQPNKCRFKKKADIHVVLIDSASWMREALIQAIIGMGATCKIKQLLLLGFCHAPTNGEHQHEKTAINRQPLMGLLFEAFHVDYLQLPLSIEQIDNHVKELPAKKKYWAENYKRVRKSLEHLCCLGYADNSVSAWQILDGLSGSGNLRLREEHDLEFDENKCIDGCSSQEDECKADPQVRCKSLQVKHHNYFERLMGFQSKLDLYYLAIARRNRDQIRTFVAIEDNVSAIRKSLEFLADATDDCFYVTKNGDQSHRLYDLLKKKEHCDRNDDEFDWSKDIEFDAIGKVPSRKIEPDAILVDLMLKNASGELLEGEEVVRHLQEHFPSLPIIVVTKSEEPDVLTRCVKLRGADRVVPKRRLLRLPYTLASYLHEEISHLLAELDESPLKDHNVPLSRRLIGAFRTWNIYPGILWHGEKTVHCAEHTLEHTLGLWKLANELLISAWAHMNDFRTTVGKLPYQSKDLFRFYMSLWLHDIGSKGTEAYQMADQVRERHSWISAELLHRNPEIYMLQRGEEVDVIELLCGYHQSCAPFREGDPTKATVKGLFHQSLEEIEKNSRWNLMAWTALLRLLDAIEHNWRRVGNEHLYRSKKATIAIDAKYYRERGDVSPEAKRYADMLDGQDVHMRKHMSVKNVTIRTKIITETVNDETDEKRNVLLFWPEYEFADEESAKKFFKVIGTYALTEWYATGKSLEDDMLIRLPYLGEIPTRINEKQYCVCQLDSAREFENLIKELKNGTPPEHVKMHGSEGENSLQDFVDKHLKEHKDDILNSAIGKEKKKYSSTIAELNDVKKTKNLTYCLEFLQQEVAWIEWQNTSREKAHHE